MTAYDPVLLNSTFPVLFMKKTLFLGIIYALIITTVFGLLFTLTDGGVKHKVSSRADIEDLQCDGVCFVPLKYAEIYNNRLFGHGDFADGGSGLPSDKTDFENFLTYRFFLRTEPGSAYGFFSKKSDYAMKVFADGVLIAETGRVADDPDDFVPSAGSPRGSFTAAAEETEIIIQQANFNHRMHYDTEIMIGPERDINRYSVLFYIGRTVIFISLITVGLMNLGMYFFFDQKKKLLYLTCLCFAGALNYATPYLVDFISGGINWYISHRVEYCSKILISFFVVAYADAVFEGGINKYLKRIFMAYSAACLLITVIMPSDFYTGISTAGAYILVLLLAVMLANLAVSFKKDRVEIEKYDGLIIYGFIILMLFSFIELIDPPVEFLKFIQTETGIVVFTFINTVALALDFNETRRQLDEAIIREKELLQTNEAMVKIGNMRDAFFADLSHELKTPLTVIGNISALTKYQLKNGIANERTVSDLEKAENEAVRLGKMVDNLKLKSVTKFENNGEKTEDLAETLNYAADFCLPLCKRYNNRISVACGESIKADISEDLIFHCMYNLISNASRHCRNSVIELSGKAEGDKVMIAVTDHGDGMTGSEMEKAFNRGYSGDSGTGIGLTLCREIAEDNGGSILLSDTPGGGLTVTIIFNGC